MPQANEAVWLPVLPSFKDFGPALITGAGSEADDAGSQIGERFGRAMVTGVAAAGAGVAAAGVFLYKVGEVFDDVADTIRVGTGASGDALDGLVESAKRVGQTVPAEFEQVGSTVADINTRMGLSGDTLETVAAQYLEAGRILGEDVDINKTSAAFNAFGIEGEAVVGAMDHLFQVSQATGVGMNELATVVGVNAPAMKALGFSFQETAVMAGSLDKAGLNSNKMMAAMSKGMVTLAKDGEAPQAAFQRVVGEINGYITAGDQAAALELAGKVFGTKGAPQFIEALQSGALNLDDLTRAAGQSADSILGVGQETMDFAEAWQLFKNNILVWLEPLGATVFGALGTWMGMAVTAVGAFTDAWARANGTITQGGLLGFMETLAARALIVHSWFQNSLVPALAAFGGWVQQNAAALGFFAAVLGAAGGALGLYVGTIRLVTTAKTAWAAIMTALQAKQIALNAAMAANPIGIVLVALAALVAGLVFAYTHFESFRTIVNGAWAGIVSAAQNAWNGVLLPIFTAISTWVTGVLAPMFTRLWVQHVAPAWAGIVAAVQSAWAVIGPALTSLGSSISALGALILSALVPAFTFLAPIVGRVAQVLGVVLGGAITVAVGFITLLVSAFVDHLAGAIRGAITFIQGLISFVSAVFRGDWASAWNAAKDMAVGAFQFLWHAINVVLTVNVLGAVRSGLAAMLGLFRGGMSSITGVFAAAWNGI
ncbi:phage tail tape measure protein, partial [Micrococcus sp.]|uniref:phage tail tape measure protein n=1 Tax=Micrococcus sp. TaxID=1271 RepID=UPI0026DAE6A6